MKYNKLLFSAIDAALKAGAAIRSIYNDQESDFEVEHKADLTPITIADKKAHEIIVAKLNALGYPILSEEGKHFTYSERKHYESVWIVDPLDGTREFIDRNGEFTVNIAFIVNSKPIIGVIYIPVTKQLYFSTPKLGAYVVKGIDSLHNYADLRTLMTHSVKLPCKRTENTKSYIVVGSRSHLSDRTKEYIRGLQEKHSNLEFRAVGSSIKLCFIAEGSADIYPRFEPTMEWDIAAGHAIVEAAGKNIVLVSDPTKSLVYNKEDLYNPWFIVE